MYTFPVGIKVYTYVHFFSIRKPSLLAPFCHLMVENHQKVCYQFVNVLYVLNSHMLYYNVLKF